MTQKSPEHCDGIVVQEWDEESPAEGLHVLALGALAPNGDAVDSVIDGVLCQYGAHSMICWTMTADGRRAIVGLEVLPRDRRSRQELIDQWLVPRLCDFKDAPPPAVPLPATVLRHNISFREVFRLRRQLLSSAPQGTVSEADLPTLMLELAAHLPPEEQRRIPSLVDAVIYDRAMKANLSPAEVIAERRSISQRTAEGRIAKARALGLLSAAEGPRAGGQLTETAVRLLGQLASEAEDPTPTALALIARVLDAPKNTTVGQSRSER